MGQYLYVLALFREVEEWGVGSTGQVSFKISVFTKDGNITGQNEENYLLRMTHKRKDSNKLCDETEYRHNLGQLVEH